MIHGVRLVDGIYSGQAHQQQQHHHHHSSAPMGSPDHPYPVHAHSQLHQFHDQGNAQGPPPPPPTQATLAETSRGGGGGGGGFGPGSGSGPLSPKRPSSPQRRYEQSTFASRANEIDYAQAPLVSTLTSYNMRLHARRNSPPRMGDFVHAAAFDDSAVNISNSNNNNNNNISHMVGGVNTPLLHEAGAGVGAGAGAGAGVGNDDNYYSYSPGELTK